MTFVQTAHLTPYTPAQAGSLVTLWDAGLRDVADLWAQSVSAVQHQQPASAYLSPRDFIKAAKRQGQVASAMRGLQGLFLRHPVTFESWVWALITDVRPSLAYEVLLKALGKHGTVYPQSLAALIHTAVTAPASAKGSPFRTWADARARASQAATLPATGPTPAAVLLVPGHSMLNGAWSNASAKGLSAARGRLALPTIDWLLRQHTPRGEVLVVCSGGSVKSPTPESTFIAAELRRQMAGWSASLRRRVRLHEDPFARHSCNNARALARVALTSGAAVRDTWVVTSPGHMAMFRRHRLSTQWKQHAMHGLEQADQDAIERHFPLTFDRGTPLLQVQRRLLHLAHRAPLVALRSTALVPCPGNALDR